jgi:hypothetical protein
MECPERNLLLSIYRERAKQHAQAVTILGATNQASLSLEDFMKRWECAEFARDACTLARIEVWSHVANHGCLIDGEPLIDRMAA